MILGYTNTLGFNATLESAIPPTNENFDFLEMCGNFTVDELQVLNTVLTQAEILDMTTEQVFGTFHILLAHFENDLEGGNFSSGGLTVTNWNILRRLVGETNYTLIATVPATTVTQYLDIRARSGSEYEYAVQSVSSGTAGNLVESEAVSMSFWGWSVQSLDYDGLGNGTIYFFDTEINSDSFKLNRARTKIETHSQYPKIYKGLSKYHSGGLKFFPVSCNGDQIVEPNLATLNALRDFVEDDQAKILKNGTGEAFLVDTFDFNYKYRDILTNQQVTNNNPNSQPYDITFKVDEIGDVV